MSNGPSRREEKEQWKAKHGGQLHLLEVDLLLAPIGADKQLRANLWQEELEAFQLVL